MAIYTNIAGSPLIQDTIFAGLCDAPQTAYQDSSRLNNDCTLAGSPTFAYDATLGRDVFNTSVGNYASTGYGAAPFHNTTAMTIAAWVMDTGSAAAYNAVLSCRDAGNKNTLLFTMEASKQIAFWIENAGGSDIAAGGTFGGGTSATQELNTWRLWIGRWVSGGKSEIYSSLANGTVTKVAESGSIITGPNAALGFDPGTARVQIAADPAFGGSEFVGKFGDIVVWNRALTTTEMQSLADPTVRVLQNQYNIGVKAGGTATVEYIEYDPPEIITPLNSCFCNIFDYVGSGGLVASGSVSERSSAYFGTGGAEVSGTASVSIQNYVFDGIRAFYMLNEEYSAIEDEVIDFTRSQLHGTAGGGNEEFVPILDSGIGCQGSSLFDEEAYIQIPKDSLNQFTVSIWVKKEPDQLRNEQGFYSRGNSLDGGNHVFSLGNNILGGFQARIETEDGVFYCDTTAKEADKFYLVQCSFDGSTLRLYVNGELEDSVEITGTPLAITGDGYIGKRDQSTGFLGNVQMLKLYSEAKPQYWLEAEFSSYCDPEWAVLVS